MSVAVFCRFVAVFMALFGALAGSTVEAAEPRECFDLAREARRMLRQELGVTKGNVVFPAGVVCDQMVGFDNRVPFLDAVRAAMESFHTDSRHIESPLAIAIHLAFDEAGIPPTDPVPAVVAASAKSMLQDYLARRSVTVRLLPVDEQPEGGESVEDAWIIALKIPEMSDHLFWAVVDRSGKKAPYNYGFN